jgi:hypothetical protein
MFENRIIMRDACKEITREIRETAGIKIDKSPCESFEDE